MTDVDYDCSLCADGRCFGCDCCSQCTGGHSCSALPEYNCSGWCGQRGQPGHFDRKPEGDAHPEASYPERYCFGPCCRPAENTPP